MSHSKIKINWRYCTHSCSRTKTIEKEKKKRRLRLKNFFIRDKNKNNEETKEVKSSTLKRNQTREKSSSRHLEPSDTDQVGKQKIHIFPPNFCFYRCDLNRRARDIFWWKIMRSTRRRFFASGSTPCEVRLIRKWNQIAARACKSPVGSRAPHFIASLEWKTERVYFRKHTHVEMKMCRPRAESVLLHLATAFGSAPLSQPAYICISELWIWRLIIIPLMHLHERKIISQLDTFLLLFISWHQFLYHTRDTFYFYTIRDSGLMRVRALGNFNNKRTANTQSIGCHFCANYTMRVRTSAGSRHDCEFMSPHNYNLYACVAQIRITTKNWARRC